jgi:L-malate glycosyltransferase
MKILQLVTRRQYRGAEVSAANLSRALIDGGHEIVWVGLFSAPEKPLEVTRAKNVDLNGRQVLVSISLLRKLVKLIRREKPDILQANGSDTLKYLILARILTQRIPILYRNISLISTWMGRANIKLLIYRWLFMFVDYVVSVGHESREDFIRTIKFPENRIKVIRRGIPALPSLSSRKQIREQFQISDTDFLLIHVGNFSPEKNQALLVEVMSILRKHNASFVLLLVGDGSTQARVQQLAHESNLDSCIHFAGLRQDVGDLLRASDLNVLCSFVEGVPGVVLEAAMVQLPTVAVNVGGTSEVIEHNVSGILLERHNPEDMAKEIMRLSKDLDLKQRLGQAAYTWAMNEFSWEKSTQEFVSLYHQLRK